MEVNWITLHCSNCEPSGWIDFEREDVNIFLDLKSDEYTFTAECPQCKYQIVNKRRAFK